MKAPHNRHQIKSLLFDIVFDDERRAQELYDDVRRLHYKELESVICRCLDQFADQEAFASLKTIELDLGPIHYRDINKQLGEKLYDCLYKKLYDISKASSVEQAFLQSPAKGHLEILWDIVGHCICFSYFSSFRILLEDGRASCHDVSMGAKTVKLEN